VRATYDLLRTKNVKIVRSERLCIRHELLAKPGTKLSDITEVHSHEQALGQCSEFLKSLGDKVEIIPAENTAMAAEYAAKCDKPGVAAIASHSGCKIYGLETVATDIQNSDNNYTRFVCIAKDTEIYPGADHISLILALSHRPGALYEILSKLAALEVNLIKLESCPIIGHDFEFMFFFELQASVRDPKISPCWRALNGTANYSSFWEIIQRCRVWKNASYGLLGRKLGHSYSPMIHRELGNPDYELIELEPRRWAIS
jgi:chorismate mutase/prephenate dehydratase